MAVDSSGITQSFLQHQTELIVADIKELVSRVSDVHFVEADNLTVPAITYEVGMLTAAQHNTCAVPIVPAVVCADAMIHCKRACHTWILSLTETVSNISGQSCVHGKQPVLVVVMCRCQLML